ncbi:MAG TPA: hypothetical protein PKY29_08110 [Ferruginibacter sp.]|nr:hypothetical protein [Ferruginibacter sp.]HRO17781.1 hypothetical protein [Ferruginibacter sp.]HRQ21264.1 hypothetical protein [Ferruginibacter sp.]
MVEERMFENEKNTRQELSELAPGLLPVPDAPLYEVPEGYFDTFPLSLLKQTTGHSSGIQGVPAGYFDQFADTVLQKVKAGTSMGAYPAETPVMAPVHTIGSPRFSMMRYALAAACTGLLGLGVFQWIQSASVHSVENNYLSANQIISENRYEEVLQSISGEEIIAYLESSGFDVNAALVAEAAMEEDLPAPEDYWLDDNTLDQFLQKLNLPDINEM